MIPCAHGKLNVKHHRTTPKQEIHTSRKKKLRSPSNSIERQNVHRRRSSSSSSSAIMYIRVYTSEIDFHEPGIYEECEYGLTIRTCFTARRLEVIAVAGLLWIYFVVCFFSVWWDFVFFSFSSLRNAQGLLQVRGNLASCTSLLVMRQARGSEATEAVFCL